MKREEVQNALGAHADVLKVKHLIGCGSFGSVWLASDRTLGDRPVALKVLDRLNDYEGVKAYAGGVKQHPNLLQIFFCDTCAEKLFYAMELADNVSDAEGDYRADTLAGRLVDHAVAGTRPSTDEIRSVILGLLNGLATMHSCGYCHRDIKPENVIFVAGVPKLSDVGSVRRIVEADTSGVTPCYLPPEMCEGKYDPIEHDLYSIGMLVYCMLSLHGGSDYPVLDDIALLKDKTIRRLNAFVTERACAEDPSLRYHDIDEFRADFERCFRRLPIAQLVTGGIFLFSVLALAGWGLYEHLAPNSADEQHRLKLLSSPLYVTSSEQGVASVKLYLSGEIRRQDLPLTLVLPKVSPGTVLRLAPTNESAIPERLQDVYGSWSDWGVFPFCEMMFLQGRGTAVTLASKPHICRKFPLGEIFRGRSRKVNLALVAAEGDGVDVVVNGRTIAPDFFKTGKDPVRLLIGVSSR